MATKDVPLWMTDKGPPPKYPRLNLKRLHESLFDDSLDLSYLVEDLFSNVSKVTFTNPAHSEHSDERRKILKSKESRKPNTAVIDLTDEDDNRSVKSFEVIDSDDQSISELAKTVSTQVKPQYEVKEDPELRKQVEKFHEKPKRGFREKNFVSMPVSKRKMYLNHCVCCGFSPANRLHPFFKNAGLCSYCEALLKKLPEVIDPRDGYQMNCSICCREGQDLVMCDSGQNKCLRSFCFQCLNLFIGPGGAQSIRSAKTWKCFFCSCVDIGTLILNKHWKAGLEKFTKNGARIHSKNSIQVLIPSAKQVVQTSCSSNNSNKVIKSIPASTKKESHESNKTNIETTNFAKTPRVSQRVSRREIAETEQRTEVEDQAISPDGNVSEDDNTILADFRMPESSQKENMQPSPAGSDIANNNCLPASCDQNLMAAKDCSALTTKVRFSIGEEEATVTSPSKSTSISRTSPRSHSQAAFARSSSSQNIHPVFTDKMPHTRTNRFFTCTSAGQLKKFCLCCTSKNVTIPHPMFIGGVCDDCLPRVTKSIITIMEFVPEEDLPELDLDYLRRMCCVCCKNTEELKIAASKNEPGSTLFRCSQPSCYYAFCDQCLSGLVSSELIKYFNTFKRNSNSSDSVSSRSSSGTSLSANNDAMLVDSNVVTIPTWSCYLCSDNQYQGILKLQI